MSHLGELILGLMVAASAAAGFWDFPEGPPARPRGVRQ
jgi:hypothetical protein